MIILIAWLVPAAAAAGALFQNVLSGINNRKARLYNSPKEEVKRLNEAALPLAAKSNIGIGGGATATPVTDPVKDVGQNLLSSQQREINRKQLSILDEELRIKKAQADVDTGNATNILNPTGQFTPTNQGVSYQQQLAMQAAAVKTNEIVNSFMPSEKQMGLAKSAREMQEAASRIANNLVQNKILVSESRIKDILADYQPSMSKNELSGLILRNAGQYTANQRAEIQREIESTSKEATISMNQWRSTITSEELKRMIMTNENMKKQFDSYDAWFDMKKKVDYATQNKFLWSPADIQAFIYSLIYNPSGGGGNINQLTQLGLMVK